MLEKLQNAIAEEAHLEFEAWEEIEAENSDPNEPDIRESVINIREFFENLETDPTGQDMGGRVNALTAKLASVREEINQAGDHHYVIPTAAYIGARFSEIEGTEEQMEGLQPRGRGRGRGRGHSGASMARRKARERRTRTEIGAESFSYLKLNIREITGEACTSKRRSCRC